MNELLVISISAVGALVTYYLHINNKLDVILASALPTLVFTLLCKIAGIIFSSMILEILALVFFGATFVGMSNKVRLGRYHVIALAGVLYGLIYLSLSEAFAGYGGRLGITAAVAVLISISINSLLQLLIKRKALFYPSTSSYKNN